VDDQRVGVALRAVRIKRGWTQAELANKARVSASLISLIERGHLDRVSVRVLRRVAGELEIRLDVAVRLRGGDLDRILNAGHARLHEELARYLDSVPGWVHAPEVSFAIYRDHGVMDILAFHEPTHSLLIIELKTELVSFEDLFMTMDVRMRVAARVARERGWNARTVSCWVVVADSRSNRRRAAAHRAALFSAFPANGHVVRAWLRDPGGSVRGLSFWSNSNGSGAKQGAATRRRVRHARDHSATMANRAPGSSLAGEDARPAG
jgi:transcriptional regulator with XRE-family HTH domain